MQLYLVEMRVMSEQGMRNWGKKARQKAYRFTFHGIKSVYMPQEMTETIPKFERFLFEKMGATIVQVREGTRVRTWTGKLTFATKKLATIDFRDYERNGAGVWSYDRIKRQRWFIAGQPKIVYEDAKLVTYD